MAGGPVRARLRLWRVQTLALTAIVPVVGALVFVNEPSGDPGHGSMEVLPQLVLLFMTGALFHVFGFVLNEWADLEVDRASEDLQDKPLVSGQVPPAEAKWTAIAAAGLAFVPLAVVSLDPWAHLALLGAILVGGAYDLWGKRLPLDLLLAGSITLLLMAGALGLGDLDLGHARHLTLLACVGGLQFLQNLYQNAIEGGIKDADHDAVAGARTYAALLGVRIGPEGDLVSGPAFNGSAIAMKALQISLLLYTAVEVSDLPGHGQGPLMGVLLGLAISGMVVTTGLMLPPTRFDRARLRRTFSVHELSTFGAIMLVLAPLIGPTEALGLFLLPMAWFMAVNRLLFSGALEPGV